MHLLRGDGRHTGQLGILSMRRATALGAERHDDCTKIAALMVAIRRPDVEVLSPAERQRLADLCRYIAALAEPEAAAPKTGVLHDLKAERRNE